MRKASSKFLACSAIGLLILIFGVGAALADDTNVPSSAQVTAPSDAAAISNQTALRSSLEIQDQLHHLQMANDQYRKESADALADLRHQLDLVQSNLVSQNVANLKLEQETLKAGDSNKATLQAARIFAAFGCVVLLAAAYLQWRMVSRVRVLATSLPGGPARLEAGVEPAALGMGETALLASQGLERSTAQFLSAIDRLESRIRDMEAEATADRLHRSLGETNGSAANLIDVHPRTGEDKSSVLLSKGQTLLKLDKPEEALACLDEALGNEPQNAEILLARGAALERLQRLPEAIECYDRAIASDASMTMAYLHKGGVFNRMERYSEALECYEQALKSQERARVPEGAPA